MNDVSVVIAAGLSVTDQEVVVGVGEDADLVIISWDEVVGHIDLVGSAKGGEGGQGKAAATKMELIGRGLVLCAAVAVWPRVAKDEMILVLSSGEGEHVTVASPMGLKLTRDHKESCSKKSNQ